MIFFFSNLFAIFWFHDFFSKYFQETFVTAEEFGSDLEHVEVLQRKFDEFQKDMTSQEFRITEVSDTAEKIISQRHPDSDTVAAKRKEVLEEWARLKKLASSRQGKFLIVVQLHSALKLEKMQFQKCKKTLFAISKMAKNQFLHKKKV